MSSDMKFIPVLRCFTRFYIICIAEKYDVKFIVLSYKFMFTGRYDMDIYVQIWINIINTCNSLLKYGFKNCRSCCNFDIYFSVYSVFYAHFV